MDAFQHVAPRVRCAISPPADGDNPERVWYMPGERTSVFLAADLAAAVKASGVLLAGLVRRGLAASTAAEPVVQTAAARSDSPARGAASLAALPDGEPGPGTVCSGPGCWNRTPPATAFAA